jgi:hypothetical protein
MRSYETRWTRIPDGEARHVTHEAFLAGNENPPQALGDARRARLGRS